MFFKRSFFATAATLLVSSGHVIAADSADLSMTGRIVPASCDVQYSDGGVVNFADIQTAELNDTTETLYKLRKTLTWAIDCTGQVPVAMKWTDNKFGEGIYYPGGVSPQPFHFSIGKDTNNAPIGRLYMTMGAPDAIAVTGGPPGIDRASVLRSTDKVNWTESPTSEPFSGGWTSFAHVGNDPVAFTTYSGGLEFITTFAPMNTLNMTSSLDFAASITMDLEYL